MSLYEPASKRNRHTGRINAYKRDILDKAKKNVFVCAQGHTYSAAQVGTKLNADHQRYSGWSIVRQF